MTELSDEQIEDMREEARRNLAEEGHEDPAIASYDWPAQVPSAALLAALNQLVEYRRTDITRRIRPLPPKEEQRVVGGLPPGIRLRPKDEVEWFDGKRWRRTTVDAAAGEQLQIGWICVEGWQGRAGPISVRIEHIRLPHRCMACLTPVRPGANDPCLCATSPLRSDVEKIP